MQLKQLFLVVLALVVVPYHSTPVLLAAGLMLVCDKLRMHGPVVNVLLLFALGCMHDGWQIES